MGGTRAARKAANEDAAIDADSDGEDALRPKRTTSYVARLSGKATTTATTPKTLEERLAIERERSKYWGQLLLLFPLVAVVVALTTIVLGGVAINAANNQCNSKLMTFLQGAVALSHVLVLFFAYCWMSPKPIKRLRTVRIFYIIYGLVCFAWWGIFGTSQAMTATNSGFQSCLSLSPSLYILSMYEVVIFWLLFLLFIGFVVNNKLAKMRRQRQQVLQQQQPSPTQDQPSPTNIDDKSIGDAPEVDLDQNHSARASHENKDGEDVVSIVDKAHADEDKDEDGDGAQDNQAT